MAFGDRLCKGVQKFLRLIIGAVLFIEYRVTAFDKQIYDRRVFKVKTDDGHILEVLFHF